MQKKQEGGLGKKKAVISFKTWGEEGGKRGKGPQNRKSDGLKREPPNNTTSAPIQKRKKVTKPRQTRYTVGCGEKVGR